MNHEELQLQISSPIVSVIVPVYNVASYFANCIRSVREQTLENIEIILVDDGSTDASSDMCDEAAAGDTRIHVIHKKMAG